MDTSPIPTGPLEAAPAGQRLPVARRPRYGNSATASSVSCTGCLKTNTVYDENTAWAHLQPAS